MVILKIQIKPLVCRKTQMQDEKLAKLTVEEYLKIEEESNVKYEYHDGDIYAMAGGTVNHSRISVNIAGEIRQAIKNKNGNCEVLNSDVKLHISKENRYLYPDNMVICGEVQESESLKNSVTNPKVIIEVLSKSTKNYDKGDKFVIYKEIGTLEEYILIEQDTAQVHLFTRKSPDLWKIVTITGLDKVLNISSLKIDITLADIYYNVKL